MVEIIKIFYWEVIIVIFFEGEGDLVLFSGSVWVLGSVFREVRRLLYLFF